MNKELIKAKLQKTLNDFCNYIQKNEEEYSQTMMEEFKYEFERLNLLIDFLLEKGYDDELATLQEKIPIQLKTIYMFM